MMNFGQGTVSMAYRPIPFDGTFAVENVIMAMGFGNDMVGGGGKPIAPMPMPVPAPGNSPEPCVGFCDRPAPIDQVQFDGLPEVEVFDRVAGTWRRLPHFSQGTTYELAAPSSYVDPSTGTIQVRFVNERQDGVNFSFSVSLEGVVR